MAFLSKRWPLAVSFPSYPSPSPYQLASPRWTNPARTLAGRTFTAHAAAAVASMPNTKARLVISAEYHAWRSLGAGRWAIDQREARYSYLSASIGSRRDARRAG